MRLYLVDSGSPEEEAKKVRELCVANNVEYIYIDTRNEMFSAGKARDIGAIYSNTDFITFQDIDCLPYGNFYNDLLNEIVNEELNTNQNDFFVIPCLFLTEKGSELYLNTPVDNRRELFYRNYFYGNSELIKSFALSASSIVVHRLHYLSIGGIIRSSEGMDLRILNCFTELQLTLTNIKDLEIIILIRRIGTILIMKALGVCSDYMGIF